MNRTIQNTIAAIVLPIAASCSAGLGDVTGNDDPPTQPTPPPGFDFANSESVTLGVSVTLDGVAEPGVTVQLRSPRVIPTGDTADEAALAAQVFYLGATDVNGAINVDVDIPVEYDELDLVVHRFDTSGPYSDENLRTFLGPVAPSAQVRVTRAAAGLQIVPLTTNP